MSDYSVQGVKNRPALEGEVLVIYRFDNGSKGLISPQNLDIGESKNVESRQETPSAEPSIESIVGIPDGAELVMTGISPSFQSSHHISPTEVVIFRRVTENSEAGDVHRETVEFRNGARVALEDLEVGQRVGILALSAAESVTRRKPRSSHTVA